MYSFPPPFRLTGPPPITSLPDLTSILTSATSKSKSLTPQPISANSAKNPPSASLTTSGGSTTATKRSDTKSAASVRSSSLSNSKANEKRLSTLPNNANYPLPSYLSIASAPTGYLRSSSTSCIPSLAASTSSSNVFAQDSTTTNNITTNAHGDPCSDYPFLKPGTPPILVIPGAGEGVGVPMNELVQTSSLEPSHQVVADDDTGISRTFSEKIVLRKPKATNPKRNFNNDIAENGILSNGVSNNNNKTAASSSYDFDSSNAPSLPLCSSFDFKPIITTTENDVKDTRKHEVASMSSFPSHGYNLPTHSGVEPPPYFVVPKPLTTLESSFSLNALSSPVSVDLNTPQTVLNDGSKCSNAEQISNYSDKSHVESRFISEKLVSKSVSEPSTDLKNKIDDSFEDKSNFQYDTESLELNRKRSISVASEDNPELNSPIRFAKLQDLKHQDPVTNFASTYMLSPKVDKTVHKFNFEDEGNDVKIVLDHESELISDGELDSFVSEIQRSFTTTPVPTEEISIKDLQPPEFFRSISRNEEPECDQDQNINSRNSDEDIILTDIDDTYEEHDIVTVNVYQKQAPSQVCTMSKPKVMSRDSACPQSLKQKAVSNLEMLSTLSAMSKSTNSSPPKLENMSNGNDLNVNFQELQNTFDSSININTVVKNNLPQGPDDKSKITQSSYGIIANAKVVYQNSSKTLDKIDNVSTIETKDGTSVSKSFGKVEGEFVSNSKTETINALSNDATNERNSVKNSLKSSTELKNSSVTENGIQNYSATTKEETVSNVSSGNYNSINTESNQKKIVSKTFITECSDESDNSPTAKLGNFTKNDYLPPTETLLTGLDILEGNIASVKDETCEITKMTKITNGKEGKEDNYELPKDIFVIGEKIATESTKILLDSDIVEGSGTQTDLDPVSTAFEAIPLECSSKSIPPTLLPEGGMVVADGGGGVSGVGGALMYTAEVKVQQSPSCQPQSQVPQPSGQYPV